MMARFILSLIVLGLGLQAQAAGYQYLTRWTAANTQEVVLACSGNTPYCDSVCGVKEECIYPEPMCRNCLSSQVFLTHLLEQMGRDYVNTGKRINNVEIDDFLKLGDFSSLTSHTIYNQLYRYDAEVVKAKFQGLCKVVKKKVDYPIVLLEVESWSRRLKAIRYVICGDTAYEMSAKPELILQLNTLLM